MRSRGSEKPVCSAIVPVGPRVDELDELVAAYDAALESSGKTYEIIVVVDGPRPHRKQCINVLQEITAANERLRIIELAREFGEAAALAAGFDAAQGELLLTLPEYYQIVPGEIP